MSVTASKPAEEQANWPFRFDIVRVADIYTDKFQRPVNERWLRKLEGNFDPAMLGTVTLSERGRRGRLYSVVDGQHRIELCKRNGLEVVPAVVFYDLSIEAEATLFSRFQRERRAITPYQRFRADLIAGNPESKAIDRIVREEDLQLAEGRDDPGFIKCVVALETVYRIDPDRLRLILHLLQEAWRDMPAGRSERLVKGLSYFLDSVTDFNEERFVERLSRVTPSTLVTRGAQLREARGRSGSLITYVAEAIENEYRRRVRR